MDMDVTSVSKQPEHYAQAPAAIQVVTGDEIRRFGASSIPEALRLADNLDVAQVTSSSWNISARGFNAGLANKLLVLMDGRTVYTPLYSGVVWNAQDYLLEDLNRIEVVSGPGGTLWGANAVNGVINITSKSAKDTQGFYLEAGGGTWLGDFTGARYGGALDSNIYYRVYGKYVDRGNELTANGNNVTDSWRMGQGGFRVDAGENSRDKFTLQGDLYVSDIHMPAGSQQNYSGRNILGRWAHTVSDDSNLSLQLYYDQTYWIDPTPAGPNGPAGNLVDNLDTYDLDFQYHFRLGEQNNVSWGLGYRFTHDALQNTPSIAFLPATLDHNLYSGFMQDEIMLAEDFFFTLGTKLEHNDYTGYEVEPSARLKWNFVPRQMLWAAVSRAVRAPSRIDRDFFAPSSGTLLAGNSNFVSETLVAYELGYRAQITQEFSGSLSTFYNDYDNLRSLSLTAGAFPYVITNNVAGQTFGGELTADFQVIEGWLIHAGYDLINENLHVKSGQTDSSNGQGDTADPPNQVFLRSSMDLPGKVELATIFRWVDARPVISGATSGTVPSYFEMDVRVGWSPIQNLELSIVGQNLLQNHHPEYGFPTPAREEIARSVYGKLTCQF